MAGDDLRAAPAAPSPADLAARVRALPALAGDWEPVVLPAGALVFDKGDPGDAFYAILEGEVEIFGAAEDGGRIVLERLGPGQHFGELALVDGGQRSAGAMARSEARLERLPRAAFLRALERSPELARMTIDLLGTRMRRSAIYVDHLTRWARAMAQGDYGAARQAIETGGRAAGSAGDANVGRFIESFLGVIEAVQARETELRRELQALRIEIDDGKYRRQLSEITESDFFQSLQRDAQRMRARVHGADPET